MKVQDIYNIIDEFAPFDTACEWDNVGLLVGDKENTVTGVLLVMDITNEIIDEAICKNCNLIISHHPIIFGGIKRVCANTVVYKCIRNNITVISAHTNLDIVDGGVNTALGEKIKLINLRAIGTEENIGLVGELAEEMSAEEFANHLEKCLDIVPRYNRNVDTKIKTVGICGGSGADIAVECNRLHNIQAFVTADIKNNQFIDCANMGLTLYDCGHNATERVVLPVLQKLLLCKCKVNTFIAESFNGQV